MNRGKRQAIFKRCRITSDIVLIQEVHISEIEEIREWNEQQGYWEICMSHTCGAGILFSFREEAYYTKV